MAKRIINRINNMTHTVAPWLYEDDSILFRKGVYNFESFIAE